MKKTILLFIALVLTSFVFSQEFVITGKVTNPSGDPLEGATITIKGTKIKTFTDNEGAYSMKVHENDVLLVTYIGLTSKEVVVASLTEVLVGNTNVVDIEMKPENSIFDMSLEELMNIRISSVSLREESVEDAPQTVIVVTEEQIKQRGYTNVEQIFHDLPGFDISRGNGTAYSQIYQRGYRSNDTERTSLLIDGVEENDLWSSVALLSRQYPLSNIKRVEVIYGPASTIYGANAFLGVINIVTKNSNDIIKSGKSVGVSATAGYGTWNTKYTDLSLSGRYKKAKLTLTGRIYQSDEMDLSGYKDWNYDLDDYDLAYYKNKLDTQDDALAQAAMALDNEIYYNGESLNGKLPYYSNPTNDWAINSKFELDNFTMGFQTFRMDEGYGAWYRDDYELGPDHGGRWVSLNSYFYVKYNKEITDKLKFESFSRFKVHRFDGACEGYYYVGYMNGELDITGLVDDAGDILPETDRETPYWWHGYYNTYSQQLREEVRLIYTPSDKMTIVSGGEIRHSHIQGEYLVGGEKYPEENTLPELVPGGNHFYSRDIGLFAQANYYLLDNLNIVAGGRYDYNKIRIHGGYGSAFNPKLAIVFSPANFIFKAIYSEAFMDASYWTKYATLPSRLANNPTLKPEKVKNLELTGHWKINANIFWSFAAYNANYSDAVGTGKTTIIDENGNEIVTEQHQAIGELSIQGFQSMLHLKYNALSGNLNYNFTNPYSLQEGKDVRIGDIASHRANAEINYNFRRKLNLNLRANWVGERLTGSETTISDNPLNSIDPYWILNGAVTYDFTRFTSVQLVARNILNKEYFHPGVRSANGDYYASRLPQNEFNYMVKFIVKL